MILSNICLGCHFNPIALEGSAGTFLLNQDISEENVRFKMDGLAKNLKVQNFGLTLKENFLNQYGKSYFKENYKK